MPSPARGQCFVSAGSSDSSWWGAFISKLCRSFSVREGSFQLNVCFIYHLVATRGLKVTPDE